MLRQNWVQIDLSAIRDNYELMRRSVPAGVRVMPVIKADAYGHGMLRVARTLEAAGATDFAVALAEEGITLREGGVGANILVLGAATRRAAPDAVGHELTQTVFDPDSIGWLNDEAVRQGKTALVHIKLDTGMNRIGLRTPGEADALNAALAAAPGVKATGIYTHFADADSLPPQGGLNDFTQLQLKRFQELRARFGSGLAVHAANSAVSLLAPEAYFDMIREGISLYGYPPVPTELPFHPALSWMTEVTHVKRLSAGESVGYGRTFTAPRDMRLATVAVGYGDGYHRACSNRAQMLVCGRRANVVGRVCMDQTMIDVTDIPGVEAGAEVVLIGRQGSEHIGADELAGWAGTISYEVLLAITARVPRVWKNE